MAELTQDMIERRYLKVASNPTPVNIPGLPGLFFKPMGPKERGISSRAYSQALFKYIQEGYPSEHALGELVKRAAANSGLDYRVLARKAAILRKYQQAVPEELQGPYDQLTPEEVAELPPEEQAKREQAIRERGRRIVELLQTALTEEEREALRQIEQIEALEQHLRQQTAEWHARRDQAVAEILACAVKEDGSPYFPGGEEELEQVERLADLFLAWYQFRNGMPSDFFSRS
ncbi:MAG: hypothetical protein DIU70_003675 [Bacillota bacterium]|nr:MAG: hypothetical protein DIU70_00795 [Bacillota bacterium]